MADRENPREEIHEERWEERRHEDRRIFRNLRRMRYSPLDLQGEQHELPLLPKGTLKTFSRDGTIDAKRHIDLFLDVCDFHLVEHDDVMVILLLQNLLGQDYEWYTSLPTRSIGSFDYPEHVCSSTHISYSYY